MFKDVHGSESQSIEINFFTVVQLNNFFPFQDSNV